MIGKKQNAYPILFGEENLNMQSTRVSALPHFAGKLVFLVDSEERMDPNFDRLRDIPSTTALPVYCGAYYPILTDALAYRVVLTGKDALPLEAIEHRVKALSDQLYKPSIFSLSFWAQLFNKTTQHMAVLNQQIEESISAKNKLLNQYIEDAKRKPRAEHFSLEYGPIISKADVEKINQSFQALGLSGVQFTYHPQAQSLAHTP